MIPRLTHVIHMLKQVERNVFHMFGHPPRELALAYVHENQPSAPPKKHSLKDIVGDGFLLAVPKFRRTLEKRWKRKFGSPQYVWKMLEPKTNIIVCHTCGHHHERKCLCENCYKRVEEETKLIKDKIIEKLGNQPIEQDVVVLYEGENVPEQPDEFWKGKRIIEMKKERPQWFSKNLLQKTTQAPSKSTDVKPTDLA
ncbi:Mitochondrial ribosomal protein L32 [Operophtera brumata]|uniref:Large ribosomal subunit protein bL32m n=1 Tax=Operophtera brumata TaxID=104452 RepID=A0A0L7L1Q0_OPEBR|nr:Mitochondrial ribosomal protein L32 [Operophtera brumata]